MKKNIFLIPFIAVITLMVVCFASAELATPTSIVTEFNGIELGAGAVVVGTVGEVVPIKITFDADIDSSDVRVRVYMEGHRNDVSDSTSRFDIEIGRTYTKFLSLDMPSDADDLSEEYTLYVEIVSQDDQSEESYTVSIQRESYTFDVLSVDYYSEVSAGDVFPISVVVKNVGYNRMDDTYVVASIPALGVSTRGYVGDLDSIENYANDNHEEDSMYKTLHLRVPEGSEPGIYELEVEVYNNDAEKVVTRLISIDDSDSVMILAAVKNQDLNAGETVSYDLIVANSADDVKVFSIEAISGDVLSVSAPSLISVGPGTSETVSVTVKADKDATIGTYTFSVNVDDKQTVFGANVVGTSVSNSVVALTVVLVIIFIVLLAVLVVLLTRKEKPLEEVETSYY